jgi:hypothetical protein
LGLSIILQYATFTSERITINLRDRSNLSAPPFGAVLGFFRVFTPTVLKDGWHERKFYDVRLVLRVAYCKKILKPNV